MITIDSVIATDRTLRVRAMIDATLVGRPMTVTRVDPATGDRTIVRGWDGQPAPAVAIVIDHEMPLNHRFELVFQIGDQEARADVELTAEAPMIGDPIGGTAITATIAEWPEFAHEREGKLLEIAGSKTPVIIEGIERAATSTIKLLHNIDTGSAEKLEQMLDASSLLIIRPSCPGLPTQWVSARARTRSRFSKAAGSSVVDVIQLSHVGQPSPSQPAYGNTLGDLHSRVPSTLGELHVQFPGTLADIAFEDLTA